MQLYKKTKNNEAEVEFTKSIELTRVECFIGDDGYLYALIKGVNPEDNRFEKITKCENT